MIPLVASEESYIKDVICAQTPVAAMNLKYAALSREILSIIQGVDYSGSTQEQILTGLLRNESVRPINENDLPEINSGALDVAKSAHISLSLACDRNFVHNLALTDADVGVFQQYDISLHTQNSIDYIALGGQFDSNIIKSWSLADGGSSLLSQHIDKRADYARHIKIYDRFFGPSSLASLREVLEERFNRHGPYIGNLSIYIGAGLVSGLQEHTVMSTLSPFAEQSRILISRSNRPSAATPFAHDRYLQIDESFTFEFSAGIGCYYENAGTNRASSVYCKSIFSGHSELEIMDQDGNTVCFKF